MLKFFLRNFSRFSLAALLLVCVWLIVHHNSHRSSKFTGLKDTSLDLWLPVQKTIGAVLSFPEDTLNAIKELQNLREEVKRLQVENQSLRLEVSNHQALESEKSRLEEVLALKSKMPRKAKIARIIARDPSTWNRSFIIDAGATDGVQMDSPVISEQGIVGRVVEVTDKNSRVLMATDTVSSVSAIDVRSRVTGIVQGTGLNLLKLGYVSANEDVQKDDVIVSSGLGGTFPKGYALGSVLKKTPSDNGLTLEVEMAPAVDFAALDYVFILPPVNIYQ